MKNGHGSDYLIRSSICNCSDLLILMQLDMSLSSSCLLSSVIIFIYMHILIVCYVVFLGYSHVQIANRIHFYLAAKQIGNVK